MYQHSRQPIFFSFVLRGSAILLLALVFLSITPSTSSAATAIPTLYMADAGKNLYAINATNGATRWRTAIPGSFVEVYVTTPAVAVDKQKSLSPLQPDKVFPRVFVGVGVVSPSQDNFFAYDAITGQQLWSFKAEGVLNSSGTLMSLEPCQ